MRRIDPKSRTIYFVGNGKETGRDPYFRHFYKIGMDGKGLTLLTPEVADHTISLSPSGKYFVDSYSTPTTAPPWGPLMAATFLAAVPLIVLFLAMAKRMVDAIGFSGIK